MGRTILHLLRHNRQFATGVILLAVVAPPQTPAVAAVAR